MELHVESEWIVDQLRWLPETELDACLACMTAATGGVHWAAKDVRYEAAVPGGQEIWLKREGEKLGGSFRADLFYRLNVVTLRIPPLRERREDIPLLVEHFVSRARARTPRSKATALSPEVVSALGTMPWPGNVRELENLVERLVVLVPRETVELADLRLHAPSVNPEAHPLTLAQEGLWPLRQLEGEYISWVVARCGGNKTRAAELLGIDVSTIHRREREKGPGNSPR